MSDQDTLMVDDFTPTKVILDFQPGDDTIDIVGYVTSMQSNSHTASATKFKKFLLCNADGCYVQVIAWKHLITKLDDLQLGNIVHVNELKYNIPKKEFLKSNVPFELIIQKDSEVVQYGPYSNVGENMLAEDVSLLDAYNKIGQKIKVDALIKTEPGIYKNRDFVATVASLTDGLYELEMKLNFNIVDLKTPLLKGYSVAVTGMMEQFPPGPAILRVDSCTDIVVGDADRVSFLEILNGFRTKAMN